jgi:hypothetical protein
MRLGLLISAALLALSVAASAQSPAPAAPTPPPTQLDRIEQKLDEVLRRLGEPRPNLPGTAQGASGATNVPIPSPVPSAPPTASPESYKPGAIAIVRAAPRDPNSLAAIPPDSVGGFVYTGGLIPLTDIGTRGVRYAGPVGAEIQGWLRAKEAGRYEFATDLSVHLVNGGVSPPTCFFQAWLEDHSVGERTAFVTTPSSAVRDANATLVLGAELQPGLYRIRVWTVCNEPPGVTTTSDLLLKAPSELNLRPVTGNDLLHREG